ncbi:MAG: DUF2085 domain-containing protein [Thermomicrobiales bacterium]
MSAGDGGLIAKQRGEARSRIEAPWLFVVALGLLVAFLLAPWSMAHKAHAILHGLCAQRPSHSLTLGGQPLPFDARMTGIYGGFAVTFIYLLARGRFRAFRYPSPGVAIALGLFVAALAIDGANALLVDLGRTPLYAPDNRIRLATGLLTGISLAVALCYMTATTLWRRGDWSMRTVSGVGELGLLMLLQLPFAFVVTSGAGWLSGPVAVALVAAAAGTVGTIALASFILATGRDRTYDRFAELQLPAALALLAGVVFMAAIAGGRFWMEQTMGLQTLP